MKSEYIARHRALFEVLTGGFDALLAISILSLWSVDPRWSSPYKEAAGIICIVSLVCLLTLWWFLRRGAPRLALICLLSALAGIVGFMILPPVP